MEVMAVELPKGLFVCPDCGCARGTTMEPGWNDNAPGPWKSTCLCEGIMCRHCGEGTVRRPISNYWEEGAWTHVPYFAAALRCAECGGRGAVDYRRVEQPPKPFRVLVEDNFCCAWSEETWQAGEYDDYDTALAHCKRIVEECLHELYEPGMTVEGLNNAYKHLGEDPWIAGPTSDREHFSAWRYAGERAREICACGGAGQQDGAAS
jgi:hypothetical protein